MRTKLRKTLFWDVDTKSLDKIKNADFIIGRVLEFGDEKDYRFLRKMYSLRKIKAAAKNVHFRTRKSANFWSIIFNIPKTKFKCQRTPSQPKPFAFWKR